MMRSPIWVSLVLATTIASSCSKTDASGTPGTSVASGASGSAVAPAAAAPATSADGGGTPVRAATATSVGRWVGSYVAKVGVVDPPADAKEKAWANDPGTAAVGNGTVELVVGEPAGEARGQLKGALGELIVAGTFDGRELYATLSPTQPNAEGALSGLMRLNAAGTEMKGAARLSGHDGKTVREAELVLTPR